MTAAPPPDRLQLLLAQTAVTGIDYVYVYPDQQTIDVYFLVAPDLMSPSLVGAITLAQISITGATPDAPPVQLAPGLAWPAGVTGVPVLRIHTTTPGGFARYELAIAHPQLDVYYSRTPLDFKANCPRDLDCAPPPHACPPDDAVDFPVDYSGRDYASLRQALLDFAAARYPQWADRLEPDAGMMIAELLSALGDEMAYYQDRVAREAYLATATQRRSIRRHAQLVDYPIHDGLAASTWLDLHVSTAVVSPVSIPAGTAVWAIRDGARIDFAIGRSLAESVAGVSYSVTAACNELSPHIWDDRPRALCLRAGATSLVLDGHVAVALPLVDTSEPVLGRWVLLRTSPADPSRPARAWPVRMTSAIESTDVVLGTPITTIAWSAAQATPFELDLQALVVHGNLVPATAGKLVDRRFYTDGAGFVAPAGATPAVERVGPNHTTTYLWSLLGSDQVLLSCQGATPETASPEIYLVEQTPTGDVPWTWTSSFVGAIQAGVDALPDDGGEICIAAGTYTENVLIARKQHVVIHGCGKRTKLVAPAGSATAALQVIACSDIEIRDLAVRATEGPAILLGRSLDGASDIGKSGVYMLESAAVRDLALEGLRISARDQSGICATEVDHARFEGCVVELRRLATTWDAPSASGAGAWPGIYLHGASIVVEDCRVEVGADVPAIAQPAGGIQVAGDSSHVEIVDCTILRGAGNGITLGSISWTTEVTVGIVDMAKFAAGLLKKPPFGGQIGVIKGCITIGPGPGTPTGPGGATPIADGPIVDLRIVENDILEMGGSGIGVIAFFSDFNGDGNFEDVVEVDYLTIEDNRIADCLQLDHAAPTDDNGDTLVVGFGGISLDYVVGLDVSRNDIRGNGASHGAPACGIYANATAGLSITDNRIRANGPQSAGAGGTIGGGILVGYAVEPIVGSAFGELLGKAPAEPITGDPAIRISGNVVTTPSGPALVAYGAGQFAITDNQLSSYGFEITEDTRAYVVYLVNGGGPADTIGWVDVGALESMIGIIYRRPLGDTMFNDNQVRLLRAQSKLHGSAAAAAIWIQVDSDLAFENNQVVCEAPSDMRIGTRLAASRSLRATGNNFEDSTNVAYSASTFGGAMNTTSLNQSTHCIIRTTDNVLYDAGNLVVTGEACRDERWVTNFPEVYGTLKELEK